MIVELLQLLGPYGPSGVIVGYLLWREHKRDAREEKRDERDEARRLRDEEIRSNQAEADKDLAQALSILSERITHVRTL